ncbi:hypothetical protein AFB00_04970 [Pseudonocardia sp. HH130630-07]|nr:hypothetical protein AFB00_04970 [Pseudonocardia sp. HH130630-07]
MAEDLAAALATPPVRTADGDDGPRSRRWWDQSLSKGAAGVVVLHAARGRADLAHAWLTRAVCEDVSATGGCGLWFGAPAVAFAVLAAGEHRYPRPAHRLREAVTAQVRHRLAAVNARITAGDRRPERSEYDLVRGLSGLGALLLPDPGAGPPSEDTAADVELLRAVLGYLVRLTDPVPVADGLGTAAPGWWSTDVPSGPGAEVFAGGHADQGAAHGICGPLSLLCLAYRADIRVPGHREAIERICAWLDRWRQHDRAGGPWWPQRVTRRELQTGQVAEQSGPGRPSWCYGTPGIARAQQLAGIALGDHARQDAAEDALTRAVNDPAQLDLLGDTSVCHGWAGVTATLWHAARDSQSPAVSAALATVVPRLTALAARDPGAPVGLIDGGAGVALTLRTISTGRTNGWSRCLLMA